MNSIIAKPDMAFALSKHSSYSFSGVDKAVMALTERIHIIFLIV
jgi:hypothetical protein